MQQLCRLEAPELLVADAAHSLRQGALRVTTPSGYLMYSQVTLDVLDEVLKAHGGSVDTPWRDLTDEQLERQGLHTERGPESVRTILKLLAGHDLVHRAQIQRIRDGIST